MLGTGEYHTADQVLGCAEACQRLAVCPLATLELGCNTSCILACAPAHKSYQHPHLQYLLLGPHGQLTVVWCVCVSVCVCLARSASVILAYVHIRLITVDASVAAVLSRHGLVLLLRAIILLPLHTHVESARALARTRQHSSLTLTAAHTA